MIILHRASAHAALPPVTVRRVNYHGWTDALRLSNGLVEAIVVPQIGRVMRFQFAGQPQTSPLYETSEWAGKTGADADLNTWANFGGDKAWPEPQSAWPGLIGHDWPPDKAFDGDPFYAQTLQGGVRLTSPASVPFAARIVRTITLRPGEPRLYFTQSLIKDPHAPAPLPLGVWTITQVRADSVVEVPATPVPGQAAPFQLLMGPVTPGASPFYSLTGGFLRITHDPAAQHKISAWPRPGVLSLRYGPGLVFSEHFPSPPTGSPYALKDQPAEVYSMPGKPGYFEMEVLGPLSSLKAGESASLSDYWQLEREKR